ncbi:hypothetical protein C8F04DRAFT_1072825 [Mycena alexandri]|uniref:F-box domain-containing protein n=1 Tax=Mycena alexandri TaxID=1745969 RepID=A0AAD6XBC9_9AGAR|nr:hypothetical protein C8F04DRAFT_1072825 [Mycena alexandri]
MSPSNEISAFSSAELVQSAQRQIDREIHEYQETIRALRSRRNGLSSIGRLPPEMLSRIFFFVQSDTFSWIKAVSHICRHWRAVALGCPSLWCSPIFSRPKWAHEMLKRSKMAPLSIRVDLTYLMPRMLEAVHSTLGQISRIGELDLTTGPGSIQQILNLSDPAPYLHSLSLSSPVYNREQLTLPATFLNGEAPRLRKVELTRFGIAWDSPLMSNLVHLKIHDPDATARPSSIDELVKALGRMPLLETLELDNVLPTIAEGTTISVPSARASLSHLKHMVVVSRLSVLEVANTLNHLSYPPTTSTRISCRASTSNRAGFAALTPALSNLQSAVKPFRSLRVDFTFSGITIQAWSSFFLPSDQTPRPRPFFELELKWLEFKRPESQPLLASMCKSLPLQRLRSLSITTAPVIDVSTWLSSFADLPALQAVRLFGDANQLITTLREDVFLDDVKQVPQALAVEPPGHGRRASLRNPRQETASGGLFFPALRHLTLEGTDFSEPALDTFEETLMERCERKQDLWSLTLADCSMLESDDVLRLEEIVPEVIWDEIEQGYTEEEDEDSLADFSEDMSDSEYDAFQGYGYSAYY